MILHGLSMSSLWGSLGPNWLVKPLATWNPRHVFLCCSQFYHGCDEEVDSWSSSRSGRRLVWELPVFMNRTWENSEETENYIEENPLSLSLAYWGTEAHPRDKLSYHQFGAEFSPLVAGKLRCLETMDHRELRGAWFRARSAWEISAHLSILRECVIV